MWAPIRIGLGVDRTRVRGVVLCRGMLVWAANVLRSEHANLDAAVGALLKSLPPAYHRRIARAPTVVVAIGAPYAQVKHLVGVPPVADRRELGRMLVVNAGRFFRKNGVPLVVTGTHVDAPGRAWAAVVEAPLLAALDRACRAHSLRLTAVVPTLAVLAAATPEREAGWVDDGAVVRLEYGPSHELVGVRRDFVHGAEASQVEAPALTDGLGPCGWEYAAAYGAAVAADHEPLRLRWSAAQRRMVERLVSVERNDTPGEATSDRDAGRRRTRVWSAVRRTSAATACVAAGAWAVTAPTLAAWNVAHRARADLWALGPAGVPAQRARDASLREATRALRALSDFDARRRSMARVLAAVAQSLPRRATLISFACDTVGGTVVVVAPRAARVVAGIDAIPGVVDATVVGAITREPPAVPITAGAMPAYGTPYPPPAAGAPQPMPPVMPAGPNTPTVPRSPTNGQPGTPALAPARAPDQDHDALERAAVRFRFEATRVVTPPHTPPRRGNTPR